MLLHEHLVIVPAFPQPVDDYEPFFYKSDFLKIGDVENEIDLETVYLLDHLTDFVDFDFELIEVLDHVFNQRVFVFQAGICEPLLDLLNFLE